MENNNQENKVGQEEGTQTNNDATKVGTPDTSSNEGSTVAPKKKLGVSKDTVATSGLPIPAPYKCERTNQFPNKYVFPTAKLVNVSYDPVKQKKDGTTSPVLIFVFVAPGTPKKQFTHIEFPLDETDPKWDMKEGALNQRLKNLFDETVGEKHFKDGSMTGDTFEELFANVANAFNSVTYKSIPVGGSEDDAKQLKLYAKDLVYLKVGYNGTRLQFGLFPALIQRAVKPGTNEFVPCELQVNPGYDKIDPEVKASINAGGINAGQQFGNDINNEDFPDV